MTAKTMYNIPNLLCYFRVLVIIPMIPLFLIDNAFCAWLNLLLWTLAGVSDYLDGKIARATGQTSLLGKFLDSSADKMLIAAALIMMVANGTLTGVFAVLAVVVILREILIAGVREFLAMYNVIVPISKLGKWKLTVQMFFMGFLITGVHGEALVPHALTIGYIGFVFAAAMPVISGWDYLVKGFETMTELEGKES